MDIAGRTIGCDSPPWLIAEMSGNHNQSFERALALVEAAARSGADALKLQTYTPDTMTIDAAQAEFRIDDPRSLWHGKSLYQLYGEACTPWEWHAPLFARARELGMVPFSTPFDESAVELLESLDADCYKIASFENVDLPLIRRVAAVGKPLILSTGMASLAELDETVAAARAAGCRDLVLLKCTSSYPASPKSSHVRTIPDLQARYGCEVGLSDHTLGMGAAVASVALGARVIEKHLTLSRAEGGVDAAFSLEPAEFAALAVECRRAWEALGQVHYGPTESERPSLMFRRSLYIVRDVAAGQPLTTDHVRAIRPGLGLPPKHLEEVLGRKAARYIPRGTALAWELLEGRPGGAPGAS